MKKMLLTLVSGLLILCMAGSAMALGSLDLVDGAGNTVTDRILYMGTDGSRDIYLKVTYNNDAGAGNQNFNVAITRTDSSGPVHLSASPTAQSLNLEAGKSPLTATSPITLTMSGADLGETYDVVVGNEIIQVKASAEVSSNIPEFPTVAAPVAAILGLFFIIGRKKEGL